MRLGFDLRPFPARRDRRGDLSPEPPVPSSRGSTGRTSISSFPRPGRTAFRPSKIPPFERPRFRDCRLPVRVLNSRLAAKRRRPYLSTPFFGPRLDLAHSATPLVLPTRGKKIITVHDIFFMDFPDKAGEEAGKVFFRLAAASFRDADGIVTSSATTRRRARVPFRPRTKARSGPSLTGWTPVPGGYLRPASSKRHRSASICPRSFLLFVGAQVPRKNLVRFLDALKIIHLHGLEIPLVLAGPEGEDSESIRANGRRARPLAHDDRLSRAEGRSRNIYRLATAFVLPSLCEGFGMPLLEAMASGCPGGGFPDLVHSGGLRGTRPSISNRRVRRAWPIRSSRSSRIRA